MRAITTIDLTSKSLACSYIAEKFHSGQWILQKPKGNNRLVGITKEYENYQNSLVIEVFVITKHATRLLKSNKKTNLKPFGYQANPVIVTFFLTIKKCQLGIPVHSSLFNKM